MFSTRVLKAACRSTTQAVRCASTYKSSTGLVGLAVDPNGRETLQTISQSVLDSVKKIPAHSDYRRQVEQWFTYIKRVAEEKQDIKAIEDEIEMGQIEEVIEMAKDELELIDYYHENKGWERVARAHEEADFAVAKLQDVIYFTSPECRARNQPAPETPPVAK